MAAGMVLLSALCILLGVFPDLIYKYLPYPVEYVPYTAGKVLFYLQLLLFSGLAFFLLLPLMKRTLTVSLDTDWVWRVLLYRAADALHSSAAALRDALRSRLGAVLTALRSQAENYFSTRLTERAGVFARAWSIGTTALWIAILLTAYVLVYVI
jgi:multicomponent Na+:H+ antiporter subunit D